MRWFALVIVVAVATTAPAQARLVITFYSHSLGTYGTGIAFPHGYVTIVGTMDSGFRVDANFGFTAPGAPLDMLWHPVEGALDIEPDDYIRQGKAQFSLPISDDQYRAVWAVAEKWRTYPQPSYDLDTHNCVTFVKEMAIAVGLSVSEDKKFIHAPAAFLEDVASRNSDLLARANNALLKPEAMPASATSSN